MDGKITYCILKKYKGILIKKHKYNIHLFFIPTDLNKYLYLVLLGQVEDEDNTYAAVLMAKIPEQIIDQTIEGESEYFGDRFVEIEELNCKSSSQAPGTYLIKIPKKGYNIISDLEINYKVEHSTVNRRIYFIKGNLNLVTGEVSNTDMKMSAAKQSAAIGNVSKRIEENYNIKG